MGNISVKVFNKSLELMGEIAAFSSLILQTHWYQVGKGLLVVHRDVYGSDLLTLGNFIMIGKDYKKMGRIVQRSINLKEGNWQIAFETIDGLFNTRVVGDYEGYTNFVDTPQETIIKELAAANLHEPINPKRKLPIGIEPNQGRGNLIDFTAKHQKFVDAFADICKASTPAMGYTLSWTANGWLDFDVKVAADRSINQTTLPPVIFSDDFGNLIDVTFSESISDYANFAFVEPIEALGHTNEYQVGDLEADGLERFEVYVSGHGQETQKGAESIGRVRLVDHRKANGLEAQLINANSSMSVFEKDWFLGDIVTVQSLELGYQQDVQVIEVEEVWENGMYTVTPIFGDKPLSLIEKIKNHVK